MSESACRILASLLESRTGQELGESRRWRIESALAPLMRERGLATLDDLVARLVSERYRDRDLSDLVVEALLNNETFFYRDRAAFDLLLGPALARLERARAQSRRLSIWCAGCSTGQEAWSLAMAFEEQKLRWQGWTIDILGTDVSRAAIDRARDGVYTQFEIQRGLPVRQMMRWFAQEPGATWRLSPELRRIVRFQVHNLTTPPPHPARFDLILCRNVLLYFPADTRRLTFDKLHQAAAPDALLALGAGETVIGQTDAFAPDPDCRGLYAPVPAAEARQVRRAS